jgi:hypothetical protein
VIGILLRRDCISGGLEFGYDPRSYIEGAFVIKTEKKNRNQEEKKKVKKNRIRNPEVVEARLAMRNYNN